jgi:phosphoenolpyruvate synthase/pyruvate phosphate dikinase
VVERVTGKPFPVDPYAQLEIAIKAVFNSWTGKRAVDYRREFKITPDMANGTAVNVVAMVFGNMGDDSATGVGFTRDPGTGENVMFGEYLTNAQARMSSLASARPSRWPNWKRRCPTSTASWWPCATGLETIIGKSRTTSTPSRRACSTACKPATAR